MLNPGATPNQQVMAPGTLKKLASIIWRTTPYLPEEELKTVSTTETFQMARDAVADLARAQQAKLHRDQQIIGHENYSTEWKSANGIGELVGRIPLDAVMQMARERGIQFCDAINDNDFIKSILDKNPAYRVKVTRGTRGQEY